MRQYQDQVQTGDMTEQEFWQNFMNVKTYRECVMMTGHNPVQSPCGAM